MKIIITERQNKMLMEGLPVGIRRRINLRMIRDHLDFSILESVNPCNYSTSGDFITEMCDMMVVDFLDDFEYEHNLRLVRTIKMIFIILC